MKKITSLLFVLLFSATAFSQKLPGIDKSPMDMSYYPNDFAHDRKFAPEKIGDLPAIARVIYSRPAKKDREVFGGMVKFGNVWRMGANEAAEIKFYRNVPIQGKKVKAGTYALYAIPNADEWTIILSTDLDQWGTYSYTEDKDVLRVNVPVKQTDEMVENFTIQFVKSTDNEAVMRILWDRTLIEVPIKF
ncbi:MAG: DUF2911 domain-containing protein [Spirosomaceae bacterium]|nr:DUF2911 domain-containing protein [Spirosomataceae bacterium]